MPPWAGYTSTLTIGLAVDTCRKEYALLAEEASTASFGDVAAPRTSMRSARRD